MGNGAHFNVECMRDFLSKHDFVYEKTADAWEQGAPLGNSVVSAVVWGGNPIIVTLDRGDVWEKRSAFKPDPEKFKWKKFCEKLATGQGDDVSEFYQSEPGPTPQHIPVGRFELSLKGQTIKDYQMRLSLFDAEVSGSYVTEQGSISWDSYVSANHPTILFHYKLTGEEEANLKFRFVSRLGEFTADMEAAKQTGSICRAKRNCGMYITGYPDGVPEFAQVLKDWGYPDPVFGKMDNIDYYEQTVPENGNYAVAWTEIHHSEKEKTIVVSIMTDREHGKAELAAIGEVKKYDRDFLAIDKMGHKEWWHDFYPKSFVSIPDTRLEALYWVETYKMGCQMRPDGIAPGLGGIWTPADGLGAYCANDYHWNMQQQANIMPIFTANRLELGMSTYEMLIKNRYKFAEFCRQFFECDGEFIPHCTNLDCDPMYINQDQFEFNSLPWMAQMMWLHYRYSMDEEFLKNEVYPLMKAAARPLINDLERWGDGKLHLPWTSSPEYHSAQETYRWPLGEDPEWKVRFGPDATIDLAFLKFSCQTLLQITERLGVEDEDKEKWEDVLQNLTPFHLDKFGGFMVRGDLALTSSHRHLSHLFPIHPLHLVNYDNLEDKKIIDASVDLEYALGDGEWVAWSYAEFAQICILAHRPKVARTVLLKYVDQIATENTFCMQGPNQQSDMKVHDMDGMTIDGGLEAAAAILDFLVRSYNDVIYVCDSLPDAWDELSFWNLRAEGAFLISAKRKNNVSEFISVYSEKGGRVQLVTDLGTEVMVTCCGKETDFTVCQDKVIFDTKEGCEYIVYKKDFVPENFWIEPVTENKWERNFFGVKKRSRY